MSNRAVVFGATGAVGSKLVEQLVANTASFSHVHVIVRREGCFPELSGPRLTETIVPDFDNVGALKQAVAHAAPDVAFCCLGTTMKKAGSKAEFQRQDHDAIVHAAQAARSTPSTTLFSLISAPGADCSSSFFYMKSKGETERDVKSLCFPKTTILRPGLLKHGKRPEFRFAEKLASFLVWEWMFHGPIAKYAPNDVSVVARAMMRDAEETLSHKEQYVGKNEVREVSADEINRIGKV
jgi:uncharacterized protein YbjT (DUF2867 family)